VAHAAQDCYDQPKREDPVDSAKSGLATWLSLRDGQRGFEHMNNRNVADPDFNKAMQLHQFGILPDAVRLYQSVLARKPDHAQALNMLGLAYAQLGNLPQAATMIERALAIQPNIAGAHSNLGFILQGLNRNEDAIRQFEAALRETPKDPEALNSLGAALSNIGRFIEALAPLQQALSIKSDYAEAHFNLGNALVALTRADEAISSYENAIRLKPQFVEAHLNLGNLLVKLGRSEEAVERYQKLLAFAPGHVDALFNLANAQMLLGRYDVAIEILNTVIAANPGNAQAYLNLANTLCTAARYDEGIERYEAAIARDPNLVDAHVGLGNALMAVDRYEDALPRFQSALKLQPDHAEVEISIGVTLGRLMQIDEAMVHFRRALELDPENSAAHKNLGLQLMELGRIGEGGPHHEYRWQQPSQRDHMRAYPQPRWQGEQVAGTLLAWGEHGLGDEILYASLVRDLQARCASLVLEVQPRLVTLFQRSFPDVTVVASGKELYSGKIDVHSPAGSLARYPRPDLAAFPRSPEPFLRADEARSAELRERLAADCRAVIGVSWRSANPMASSAKSARLNDFESLFRLPDVRFVDLQYGDTAAECEALSRDLGVRLERVEEIDNTSDIEGLAALMMACDAVVSVSNTTVHLAGALGRPTWVMTPVGHGRIWYWFREGGESPWYPQVYVRRMERGQTWAQMMPGVATEVASLLQLAESPAA